MSPASSRGTVGVAVDVYIAVGEELVVVAMFGV